MDTTTLREAAQAALTAMSLYPVTVNHWKTVLLPAAEALRNALAQPVPDATLHTAVRLVLDATPDQLPMALDALRDHAGAAPVAQQAEPKRADEFDLMLSTLRYVLNAGQAANGETARDHYNAIINAIASRAERTESADVRFACEAAKRAALVAAAHPQQPAPQPAASREPAAVQTDPQNVRRELMALARRTVITDRDRILIGAAIGHIGGASRAPLTPLADSEVDAAANELDDDIDFLAGFQRGVEFAEYRHGITATTAPTTDQSHTQR
jgi:hypothetical protein